MGWSEPTAAPVLADLLPADILQRFLDIWLATGTNLLYTQALITLADFEEGPDAHKMILESLETDVLDRIETVRQLWAGRVAS